MWNRKKEGIGVVETGGVKVTLGICVLWGYLGQRGCLRQHDVTNISVSLLQLEAVERVIDCLRRSFTVVELLLNILKS